MSARRWWRLAALVALAACALSGCDFQAYDLPLPGKVVSGGGGYKITAEFRDIVSVVPRTVVMANDVPVGQVDSVKRVGWHAEVTMTIRKDIVLPADADADVRQTSLLGEKYIQLSAPRGASVEKQGRLGDGDTIPLSRTTRNPEVEEVLGALSFLLSGGGVGQLKTISTELNNTMNGRQSQLRSLFGQVNDLVGSLDQQKGDIISAMSALNDLTGTLNREHRAIGAALDSFGPALRVLNQQHRALMTMLRSLDRLGAVGTRVIKQSKANIIATLRQLSPTLRRMADAGNSLPRGLMMLASFPFPKQAATLAKGDYSNALFYMNFDLNKALSGLLKGGDTGLPDVGELCQVYSHNQCGPVLAALCTLTKVNLFCGQASAAEAKRIDGREKRAKKKSELQKALQQTLGGLLGGSTGGGGGGGSGSGKKSGSGGGLLGLLGGGG